MNARIQILLALAIFASSSGALARPAEDPREVQGRKLFARGDYEAALEIYANLFAEKGDPIYLRNIGRCHQKLEQPEKAINTFREYLRRGQVKRAERAEVEGFIQEMEELQKRRVVAAAAPPPPPTEPVRPVAPSPEKVTTPPAPAEPAPAPAAAPPASVGPGAVLTQEAPPTEPAERTPITGRWWFWTGLAALVVGGAATAFALTYTLPGAKPPCEMGTYCP